jgi:hypothetical protein
MIWSFVGDVPPANVGDWKFAGQTTRTINRVAFDGRLAPGTKVWLAARWRNGVGTMSAPCEPVMTHVGAGGPMMQSSLRSARMLYVPSLAKAA